MTNNDIYERLSGLYEKLGLTVDDGSSEKGEILACCAGISLVKDDFEQSFLQLFPNTSFQRGLSLFCELMNIDSSLTDDEKKRLIKKGLSQCYGDYIYGIFKKEIEDLSAVFFIESQDFVLTLSGTVTEDYTLLSKIGRILNNYLPPCTVARLDGIGLEFDYWDSTPYLFEDYDNLSLSFDVLDTLN